MLGVRRSMFNPQGVVDSDPPCPWRANESRESLLIGLPWAWGFGDPLSLLREQALDPWRFVTHVGSRPKLRHHAIPPEVACHIHEMIPISDHPVEIIPLPDRPMTTARPVDLHGGEAFPTGDDFSEIHGLTDREQKMDVVRHDDPSMEQVARLVEMVKRKTHGGGICGIAKQTSAQPLVEMAIDLGGEKLVVFGLGLSGPRHRMRRLPPTPFLSPLIEQGGWKRIREAKREEIGRPILLPMGQIPTRFLDLCKLVEKF